MELCQRCLRWTALRLNPESVVASHAFAACVSRSGAFLRSWPPTPIMQLSSWSTLSWRRRISAKPSASRQPQWMTTTRLSIASHEARPAGSGALAADSAHAPCEGLGCKADNAAILAFAPSQGRVCITLDHDFHTHLALAQAGGPTVVLLRMEGLCSAEQVQRIEEVWAQCGRRIEEGAAISVDARSIRIRRLPLR